MQPIKNFLNKLGLSPKEIDVYLTGLECGALQASEIAKTCGLTRPNAYDVLSNLKNKGFVREQDSGYGKKFIMANLNELQLILFNQKKYHEEIENEFLNLIPYFKKNQLSASINNQTFSGENIIKNASNYLKQLATQKTIIRQLSITIY